MTDPNSERTPGVISDDFVVITPPGENGTWKFALRYALSPGPHGSSGPGEQVELLEVKEPTHRDLATWFGHFFPGKPKVAALLLENTLRKIGMPRDPDGFTIIHDHGRYRLFFGTPTARRPYWRAQLLVRDSSNKWFFLGFPTEEYQTQERWTRRQLEELLNGHYPDPVAYHELCDRIQLTCPGAFAPSN